MKQLMALSLVCFNLSLNFIRMATVALLRLLVMFLQKSFQSIVVVYGANLF